MVSPPAASFGVACYRADVSVGSPALLLFALIALAAITWLGRRPVAIALGLAAFFALAGTSDIRWQTASAPRVAVLIDASPSTRGMWFRDADDARRAATDIARQLAPNAQLRWLTFADGEAKPLADTIAESAVERTTLPDIDADAVLLLSDGRLEANGGGDVPIYPVVAASGATDDASVRVIEMTSERVVLRMTNEGSDRTLTWPDGTTSVVPRGTVRLSHPAPAARGAARLNDHDKWPENDRAEISPPLQMASQRWWIGDSSAPPGYRAMSTRSLPAAGDWLAARNIVLDNVPVDLLDSNSMRLLTRYVRDLGGSLVIVGGDGAFSAGGYGGSALDALSPLASRPPEPRREWLVLLDASGSMAARVEDGRSRLDAAIDAADSLAAALPMAEAVNVASFARQLQPWPASVDRRVVAPANLIASGPTNLRAALSAIVQNRRVNASNSPQVSVSPKLPLRIVAMTDGDADLGDVAELSGELRAAGIVIDWVNLDGAKHRPLADVVEATGGTIRLAGTTSEWRGNATAVARAADQTEAETTPTPIVWQSDFADMEVAEAMSANATYLRADAEVMATRSSTVDDSQKAIAARWRVGAGRVAALAFAAPASVATRAAESIGSSPRDDRYRVAWDGPNVTVNASDSGATMNGLTITLADADGGAAKAQTLEQIAPGRYQARVASATRARTFVTRVDAQIIDLHLLAGETAEEFAKIGVDDAALARLASRTGGRVIEVGAASGVTLRAQRDRSITTALLFASALSSAAAILVGLSPRFEGMWRRKRVA